MSVTPAAVIYRALWILYPAVEWVDYLERRN